MCSAVRSPWRALSRSCGLIAPRHVKEQTCAGRGSIRHDRSVWRSGENFASVIPEAVSIASGNRGPSTRRGGSLDRAEPAALLCGVPGQRSALPRLPGMTVEFCHASMARLADMRVGCAQQWGRRGAQAPHLFCFSPALVRPAGGSFVDQPESGALFPTCGSRIPRRFAFATPFGRYPRDVATTATASTPET